MNRLKLTNLIFIVILIENNLNVMNKLNHKKGLNQQLEEPTFPPNEEPTNPPPKEKPITIPPDVPYSPTPEDPEIIPPEIPVGPKLNKKVYNNK